MVEPAPSDLFIFVQIGAQRTLPRFVLLDLDQAPEADRKSSSRFVARITLSPAGLENRGWWRRTMRSSTALKTEADTGNGWKGFRPGDWQTSISVRDFIVRNVTPYSGNEDFLTGASQRTKAVWAKLQPYFADERKKGVLAVDTKTPSTLLAHKAGYIDRDNEVIVGLPDAYGRGRIIGDYRRVALYGVDRLLEAKREERAQIDDMWPTDEIIRMREELSEQMRALGDLISMAKLYGHDIAAPASNAQEAFQWTYFAYLGAIKEANGAAMSIGRISTFLDIYIERDLKAAMLDESRAQELWDQLVQKLRIVRFLRTPDYDALFSGDP